MDILKNEILPLFEVTQSPSIISNSNDLLVETSINHYSLYVDLKDIYLNKSQQHTIQIDETILQYTIPLHYYEIILSGKGHYQEDIVINVYSKLNPNFVRVNVHDLLTIRPMSFFQYKNTDVLKFMHIDDHSMVSVELVPGQKLYKISNLGLPKPDKTRGNLYVWVDLIDSVDLVGDLDSANSSDDSRSSSSSDSSSNSSDSSDNSVSNKEAESDGQDEKDGEDNNDVGVNKGNIKEMSGDLKLLLELLNYHQNSNIY